MTRLSETLPSARPSFDLAATKQDALERAKFAFNSGFDQWCPHPPGSQRAYWIGTYEVRLYDLYAEQDLRESGE